MTNALLEKGRYMSASTPRLVAQRNRVSRARYEVMVKGEAYRLWKRGIWQRRERDWHDAHREFASYILSDVIFPNDPRHAQVKIRAEQLYQERKAGDALQDWLAAEQIVATTYVIAD